MSLLRELAHEAAQALTKGSVEEVAKAEEAFVAVLDHLYEVIKAEVAKGIEAFEAKVNPPPAPEPGTGGGVSARLQPATDSSSADDDDKVTASGDHLPDNP